MDQDPQIFQPKLRLNLEQKEKLEARARQHQRSPTAHVMALILADIEPQPEDNHDRAAAE